MKRFTGRVNYMFSPKKWLDFGVSGAGSAVKAISDTVILNANSANATLVSLAPIYPVYQQYNNKNSGFDIGDSRPYLQGNVVKYLQNSELNDKTAYLNTRAFLRFNILKDLRTVTNFALDYNEIKKDHDVVSNQLFDDYGNDDRREKHYVINQFIDYRKRLAKHSFDLNVGYELSKNNLRYNGENYTVSNLGTIVSMNKYWGERDIKQKSTLGSFNYNYDEKYAVNYVYRKDDREEDFVGNFDKPLTNWAMGLVWNVHREKFFHFNWVNTFSIKASHNKSAAVLRVSPFYTLNQPYADILLMHYQHQNIGFDVSAFKNRLFVNFNFYQRYTVNESNDRQLYNTFKDINKVKNKGFELDLLYKVLDKGPVNYNLTFSISSYKNQLQLAHNYKNLRNNVTIYREGKSLLGFYMRDYYGVDKSSGKALYRTKVLDADAKIIGKDTLTTSLYSTDLFDVGSAIPAFYGGMKHQFTYQQFSLDLGFTFQVGGKIYDPAYQMLTFPAYGRALHTDVKDRWQNAGDDTNIPKLTVSNLSFPSTRALFNASYLQLNTVVFSYKLKQKHLSFVKAKNANLFISAENLALWSAKKGMNVSGSINGVNDYLNNYNAVYALGVRVGF